VPFFEAHGIPLCRVLTDRGTEYCGVPDRHPYELYLAVEDIDHTRTKAKSPQTNGICERFNKTVLNEFYRVAFRRKLYTTLAELQADLDAWMQQYNETRTHQGRWCFGKTPLQTFLDSLPLAKEKAGGVGSGHYNLTTGALSVRSGPDFHRGRCPKVHRLAAEEDVLDRFGVERTEDLGQSIESRRHHSMFRLAVTRPRMAPVN